MAEHSEQMIIKTSLKAFLAGLPGTSKTTCALSFPGVEQSVWGIGEEETRENFVGREDILPCVKWLWRDQLSEVEKDELADDQTSDRRLEELECKGKHANIVKFKKYIYKTARQVEKGDRPELLTFVVDNLCPLAEEFKYYIMTKYRDDIYTREGNFDGRKFWPKYLDELKALIRLIVDLPVNVVITSHVALSIEEENASKAFEPGAQKLNKEWLPNLDGKIRFEIGGLFSYCFFLWVEESPGKPNKYYAKAEADDRNIGLAKVRFQPFPNPRRIELKKNAFYEQLTTAMASARARARDNKEVTSK